MHKISEIVRLKFGARLGHEKIARAVGLSNGGGDRVREPRPGLGLVLTVAGGNGRGGDGGAALSCEAGYHACR